MKYFLKGLVFLFILFASLNLGCFLYMYEKHIVKIGDQEKVVYLFVLKDKVDYYLGPKYQRKFTYIVKDDTTSYFCFPPTNSDFHITYTDYPYFRNVWVSASNLNKPDPKSFLKNIVLNNNEEDALKILLDIFYQIDRKRHPDFYSKYSLKAEKEG